MKDPTPQISMKRENDRDKYMIIHTSKNSLESNMKKSSTVLLPLPFPGSVPIIPIGKEEVSIPYSPNGRVRVHALLDETEDER